MIDGNQLREEFGRYLAEHKATRWGMDAALMHVCKIAYDAGKADGPGAALHSQEFEIEVPAEPGIHPLKFTGLPLQNWRDEQLHALCEEMAGALESVDDDTQHGMFITGSTRAEVRAALAKWKESK